MSTTRHHPRSRLPVGLCATYTELGRIGAAPRMTPMNTPFRGGIGDETARARDLRSLRLVVAFHYVAGALLALLSCLFVVLIRLAMGALKMPPSPQDATWFFRTLQSGTSFRTLRMCRCRPHR